MKEKNMVKKETFDDLISSKDIAKTIVKVLYNRKAESIKTLDVKGLTVISDYLVLAKAGNNTHAKSMIGEIESLLEEKNIHLLARDGYNNSNWIVVDFDDVMLHIFFSEEGDFYADALNSVWVDAKEVNLLD